MASVSRESRDRSSRDRGDSTRDTRDTDRGRDRHSRREEVIVQAEREDRSVERKPVRTPGSRHGYRRKDYGTWDGQKSSIPGNINADGTPDMRNESNILKFLGQEALDNRRRRTATNLMATDRTRQEPGTRTRVDRSTPVEPEPKSRPLPLIDDLMEDIEDMPDLVEECEDDELAELGMKLNNAQHDIFKEIERRAKPKPTDTGRDRSSSRREPAAREPEPEPEPAPRHNDEPRRSRGRDRDRDYPR
jgi:hypothetical protein